MNGQFVLGVDGGNTKTQYLLYDADGNYVDGIKAGTCSHEALPDSFEGTKREIGARTRELFLRNGISAQDVKFSVFGLAGADFEWQKNKLSDIVRSLGFTKHIVANDGFLALKAGSSVGVACINGTGTVTVGINEKGERLQIGGLGDISGDKAGASYIAMRGLNAVYNAIYRGGQPTLLKDMIFNEFGLACESDFCVFAANALSEKENVYKINLFMERAVLEGDGAIVGIVTEIGNELAKSVAGCISRLHFAQTVDVILAGSVWVKGKFDAMYKSFTETLESESKSPFTVKILKQPPAIGAVIWALEECAKLGGNVKTSVNKTLVLSGISGAV